jgi:ribonucleoside-triphosphate reductase
MATININLKKNFTTQYNKMQTEYGEEFAKLNGFADSQLSYTDFIDNFIDSATVADASVDGNANVSNKDMRTLMNEMPKSHRKLLSFNKIYYELNKKYGFKIANDWLRAEWTKALYMHDSDTATYIHYCFAYDLKDVAEKGLFFIDNFNAEPPQHLSTFIDFVKEFISFAANRSSGAVGLPNLIPYMYYFWKKDCKSGYATKSDDYYARQQIQRFIYAVNQPYVRDGMQSAFTNVSIFDGPYLEALFGGSEFPDGTFMVDELDEIKEFQKLFMEVVADIRQHNMFTFPVLTISLLRQDHKFVDEEFAKWGIAHNMKWNDSNLFIDDSVTSLSNCCRLKSNIEDLG